MARTSMRKQYKKTTRTRRVITIAVAAVLLLAILAGVLVNVRNNRREARQAAAEKALQERIVKVTFPEGSTVLDIAQKLESAPRTSSKRSARRSPRAMTACSPTSRRTTRSSSSKATCSRAPTSSTRKRAPRRPSNASWTRRTNRSPMKTSPRSIRWVTPSTRP